jgi:two-component sensor histidine kinase
MRYVTQSLIVVAGVTAATGTRWLIGDLMPAGFPFLTYFPVVILTAYFCGLMSGIASAALSTVAAYVFFMRGESGQTTSALIVALGFFVAVTAVDILIIQLMRMAQEKLEAEQAKSAALARENANLLTEAQHRISNNLQMLASLLNLQRASVTDSAARRALQDASNRVGVISRIQRNLYSTEGAWSPQKLKALVEDTVKASDVGDARVDCSIKIASLPLEAVVPIGLIVLELVSNALEHSGRSAGLEIAVELTAAGTGYRLVVADNGDGFPAGFDPRATSSLGMRVVTALVSQLKGNMTLASDTGARVTVVFSGA